MSALFVCLVLMLTGAASAQEHYQVVTVNHGGTIRGTVKWSGPLPPAVVLPINKDQAICDPNSEKKRDLERLVVGPDGGVANTIVFLKDITAGKPMELPEQR